MKGNAEMYLSKRGNIYHLYYEQDNGKLTSVSTRTKSKSEATKFLMQFSLKLEEMRRNPIREITLKDFQFEFLKHSEATHTQKTIKAYKVTFNYLSTYLKNIQLSEITPALMQEYFQKRLQGSSVFQARKDLINLNRAFNWGITSGYLLENPCKKIERFKLPEKQPRYFSRTEFEKLVKVIKDKDFLDLVIVAINTGLRQMELLTLKWEQVNLQSEMIILDNQEHLTKGKKIRATPMNKNVFCILDNRFKNKPGHLNNVFTFNGVTRNQDYITRTFKAYVRLTDINQRLSFHSLRHSFATWLIQKGASIYEISKLLGHSDIKTTEIYTHLAPENLKGATDLLND